MTRTSFGDQLQQMWHTRPVRLPRQGPIAGVAVGFGRRYHVDPVLVRIAFVVSALFGGAGIALYLLAWLVLPQEGDQTSPAESLFGKGGSSQSPTKTIVLLVALVIAMTTIGPFGMGLAGSGAVSLALMLAGWWMLHMRTPQPPPGTSGADLYFPDQPLDGGLTSTGYPGAVFPPGTGTSFYAPEQMYNPYTKLPDAYVPDPPATAGPPTAPRTTGSPAVESSGPDAPAPHGASATATPPNLSKTSTSPDTADVPATTTSGVGSVSSTPGTTEDDVNDSDTTDGRSAPPPSLTKSPGPAPRTAPVRTTERPGAFPSGPPSWDPLGVAPLAWDLPEPPPAKPVTVVTPPRPRSRLTPVVLGLAILAAAGAGALAAAGAEWMTPARIGAVALAVIGAGLVVGGFLRRGQGLLVVTAPLAAFVLLASVIEPGDFDGATVGDRTWAPNSMNELESAYHLSVGSATLDLRGLDLTEDRTVDLSVRMGDARVLLPADMTVRTDCTVTMGDQTCPTGITGPDTPGAPVLELNVDIRMGEVVVERA